MSNPNTGSPQAVLSRNQAEAIYMAMCHHNAVMESYASQVEFASAYGL